MEWKVHKSVKLYLRMYIPIRCFWCTYAHTYVHNNYVHMPLQTDEEWRNTFLGSLPEPNITIATKVFKALSEDFPTSLDWRSREVVTPVKIQVANLTFKWGRLLLLTILGLVQFIVCIQCHCCTRGSQCHGERQVSSVQWAEHLRLHRYVC